MIETNKVEKHHRSSLENGLPHRYIYTLRCREFCNIITLLYPPALTLSAGLKEVHFVRGGGTPHLGRPSQLSSHRQQWRMCTYAPYNLPCCRVSQCPKKPLLSTAAPLATQNRTRPHFMHREALNSHRRGPYVCDR